MRARTVYSFVLPCDTVFYIQLRDQSLAEWPRNGLKLNLNLTQ